jgi:FMN phosphatase YigB (HAD superfamily)
MSLGSIMMPGKPNKPVIVLDVGGVLVDFDLKPLIGALSKNRGVRVAFPPLADIDKLFLPVQTGEASLDDIVPELNASLGVSMAPSEWHALSCSIFTGEMPGMKEMLRELKNDFFLVALTNTVEVHWTFLLKTYEILRLMDGYIVSYLEGVAKPDPAIYQAVVDRYCDGGLPYFHTDDLPQYVEAARRMGWRSEVFRNSLQFKNEVLRNHCAK